MSPGLPFWVWPSTWTTHINKLKQQCIQRMNLMKCLTSKSWGSNWSTLTIHYGCIGPGSHRRAAIASLIRYVFNIPLHQYTCRRIFVCACGSVLNTRRMSDAIAARRWLPGPKPSLLGEQCLTKGRLYHQKREITWFFEPWFKEFDWPKSASQALEPSFNEVNVDCTTGPNTSEVWHRYAECQRPRSTRGSKPPYPILHRSYTPELINLTNK